MTENTAGYLADPRVQTSLGGTNPSPSARAADAQAVANEQDESTLAIVAWLMIGGVLSTKLSVTIVSGTALQLLLPFEYAMLGLLALRGSVEIRPLALLGVLAFFTLCTATAMANDSKFTSIFYVYLNYLPLIFCVKITKTSYTRFIKIHQTMMFFAAMLVFTDWGFQAAGKWMPNMEHFMPPALRFFNFNYIQALQWGAKYTKPNGFFFLETSYVAQYMAVAFVIEFCMFRRTLHLGVYIAALVVSFGGTGYSLLLLSLPMMALYARTKTVGLALALIPLALLLAANFGLFDNIMHRMNEFNETGSSGDQRFAGQLRELGRQIVNPEVMIKGIGPGNMEQGTGIVWVPPVKATVEYGVLTGIVYLALIFYCAFTKGTPLPVAYVTLIQFLLLNGGFLVPINIFYLIVMSCMVKIKKPSRSEALSSA